LLFYIGTPSITTHPTGGDVPVGRSVTLMCRGSGRGTLTYSWERSFGSSWATVSNDSTTSYTTDTTLTSGEYMYRCIVNNEAGSIVSNIATVNVFGKCSLFILVHAYSYFLWDCFVKMFSCIHAYVYDFLSLPMSPLAVFHQLSSGKHCCFLLMI